MATQPVTLTVPDGVFAGMEMAVEWNGVNYNIAVPDGVGPGQEITVELPAAEDAAPPATPGMTPVTLTVPEGVYPGMEMAVEWNGVNYNIAVPDGVGPGQEITVELPSDTEQTASTSGGGMVVTDGMYDEAFSKASRMGSKPDPDLLRWALATYCSCNGDIPAIFAAMGDDPAEALSKPTYCDTPEKFAANYVLGYFKVRRKQMVATEAMYDEAVKRASRMGSKPDPDLLRWALTTYCSKNGDIRATFAAMGDDPGEALNKPTYCDTPDKFAANYVLGYFKVRR